jgi:hypothetical protein
MAKKYAEPKYWIDQVFEKHECFGYDHATTITVKHEGRKVEVVVPDYLPKTRILLTAEKDGFLFCFGRTNIKHNKGHIGALIMAKKVSEDRYEAGVWHELFPWAFNHFGFAKDEEQ